MTDRKTKIMRRVVRKLVYMGDPAHIETELQRSWFSEGRTIQHGLWGSIACETLSDELIEVDEDA